MISRIDFHQMVSDDEVEVLYRRLFEKAMPYEALRVVLSEAFDHAASGKGHERHADEGKAFTDQPIMQIARMLGDTGGHSYQIMKKAEEANRMIRREQYDAAVREYLGVINYAAAAILLARELKGEK